MKGAVPPSGINILTPVEGGEIMERRRALTPFFLHTPLPLLIGKRLEVVVVVVVAVAAPTEATEYRVPLLQQPSPCLIGCSIKKERAVVVVMLGEVMDNLICLQLPLLRLFRGCQ